MGSDQLSFIIILDPTRNLVEHAYFDDVKIATIGGGHSDRQRDALFPDRNDLLVVGQVMDPAGPKSRENTWAEALAQR